MAEPAQAADEVRMDEFAARLASAARRRCQCATWPKPCPYHEGFIDGLEMAFKASLEAWKRAEHPTQPDGRGDV